MPKLTNVLTDIATSAITAKLSNNNANSSGGHHSSGSGGGLVNQITSSLFGGGGKISQPPASYSNQTIGTGGGYSGYQDPNQAYYQNSQSSSDPNQAYYQAAGNNMYGGGGSGGGYPGGGGYPPSSNQPQYPPQQPQYPSQQYGGQPGGGYPSPSMPYGQPVFNVGGPQPPLGFNTGSGPGYPPSYGGPGYPPATSGYPTSGGYSGSTPSAGYPPPHHQQGSAPMNGLVYPLYSEDSVRVDYGPPPQLQNNNNNNGCNNSFGGDMCYQNNNAPAQHQFAPPQHQPSFASQPPYFQSSPSNMSSRPTIVANPQFNANQTAEILRKAMKGLGCNNSKVIQSLCTINNWQRQETARAFKALYGKDLIGDLKSELSGDFEDLILALMEPPANYDANQLYKAMAGLGTKESVLIEIMTTRTNAQINAIKSTYQQLYRKDLESELAGETSGHFKRLLVSMCVGGRDEGWSIDPLKANQDARSLYRAGEQRLGTDESTFNAILSTQNFFQLRAVFDEYQKVSGHTIEHAIQNEFSSDIRDGLLAIVKSVRGRPLFFAERIYDSMKGLGTRDADLIRLIVSRSEIDLADIRDAYHRQYNTPLEKAIAGDCSGSYKEGLIALVKGNC